METFRELGSATSRGPAEWFTGEVYLQPLLGPAHSPTLRSAKVSFASAARTVWHTHPRGQMIHILSGICAYARWGEPTQQAVPGDTVWFAPGEKHWHGAAPGHPMTHLAVQEADENGEVVTWLEAVTE
ncbi:MAG: cupin domain-containing protein [Acidobacteriaceae bacterium]|nr:cupin domain-containing protein [Acidobacteriaceae bacterium]